MKINDPLKMTEKGRKRFYCQVVGLMGGWVEGLVGIGWRVVMMLNGARKKTPGTRPKSFLEGAKIGFVISQFSADCEGKFDVFDKLEKGSGKCPRQTTF